jgi:alpha-amylase
MYKYLYFEFGQHSFGVMKKFTFFFLLWYTGGIAFGQSVAVTFQVNMSYQIKKDAFEPATEFVDIAGSFNGWGSTLNKLSDSDGDSIWTTTIDLIAGNAIEFKFRYNGSWNDREEFPGTGNNRVHTVGTSDETLSFWYYDEQPPTGPAVAGVKASSTFTFTNGSIFFQEDADGLVENYEWTFEGGSPATSNLGSTTVTYAQSGTYDVKLKVSNSFSEDEILLENYITVAEKSDEDLEWWNEKVFYEIFVRSFYDSDGDGIGDFQGIIQKLDYLNDGDPTTTTDLGITGIWLMPIHDSPSYHGYDVNDYRSINPDYGTMADFKEFLAEAHKRGIKVIIDLVLNHSSVEIDWFKNAISSRTAEKRNWYRWSDTQPDYSGPWGQGVWHNSSTGYYYGLFWGGMPDLNYDEPALKEEMFDISRFWLEDVGIDGFRLDAVKYIKEEDEDLEDLPSTHDFWREWVEVTKISNPDAFSVGEAWTSTERIVPYVINNGLDLCFDFDLGSAIINGVKSGNATNVKSQISKVINSYPYYQFGTFTTNHDMNRLMDELGADEESVKLAAAMYLTLPGIPFIYYGEEIGMLGAKPDENIRRPMAWSSDANAGFTTSNPWNSPASNYSTHNVNDEAKEANSLFHWYRKLIQLRGASAAMQTGDYELLDFDDEVLGFERIAGEARLVSLINLSTSEKTILLDVSQFEHVGAEPALLDALGSARIDIKGKSKVEIVVPSRSAMVLVTGQLTLGANELEADVMVYPNPSSNSIHISAVGDFKYYFRTLYGKLLQEGAGFNNTSVNIKSMEAGVYLIHLEMDNQNVVKKIVIE